LNKTFGRQDKMETGVTGIHDNIQNAITAIIFSKHTNASFGIFFSIWLCKKKSAIYLYESPPVS